MYSVQLANKQGPHSHAQENFYRTRYDYPLEEPFESNFILKVGEDSLHLRFI